MMMNYVLIELLEKLNCSKINNICYLYMGLSENIKVPYLKSSKSNSRSNKNYNFFKTKTGNLDDLVKLHKKKKKDEPDPEIKVIKINQSSNKQSPNKQPPNKQPPNKQSPNKQSPNKQSPNKQPSKKKNMKRSKKIKSNVVIGRKGSNKNDKNKSRKKQKISNNFKGRRISLKYQPKNKRITDEIKKIDQMDTKTMKNELQNYGIEIKSNKSKLIKDVLLLSKTGNIRIHKE